MVFNEVLWFVLIARLKSICLRIQLCIAVFAGLYFLAIGVFISLDARLVFPECLLSKHILLKMNVK